MRRLRSPSLFWTFAVAFLAVLAAATVLQVLVIGLVLRPIAARWVEARGELLAQKAARDLGELPSPLAEDEVRSVLLSYQHEVRFLILVYREPDGRIIMGRPMRPPHTRWIERHLGEELGVLEPPDHVPPPPRGAGRDEPRRRLRLLARYPVERDSRAAGEVIALMPAPRFELWPAGAPGPILLYLPVAVLVAGAAGLILFRLFLGRLRSLEELAARVSAGDLAARVPDPGRDEIGRLGERLNRMTESLAEAKRRVDESERQRKQLLADISHELATPLTSIRGYTETLLEPSVPVSDDEGFAYLRNILEEAQRMGLLIQDLLDLTRLETGAIALERVRLDWTELCRNTMGRFEARFKKAGLDIQWAGPIQPAGVLGDGRRLEQVLENLLVNALRYVPTGGTVTLSLEPARGAEEERLRLTVSDDGPGLPPENLPHIFDRFYRADAARSTAGSGLGLAIVKEIVRRHGGEVRAENRQPTGAAIVVELPADREGESRRS